MEVHWLRLTEYFFVRFGGSVVSFLESWKLHTLARSFTSRRRFPCSLLVRCGHGWKKTSGKESKGESLIYGSENWTYLYCHVLCGLLGPTEHESLDPTGHGGRDSGILVFVDCVGPGRDSGRKDSSWWEIGKGRESIGQHLIRSEAEYHCM